MDQFDIKKEAKHLIYLIEDKYEWGEKNYGDTPINDVKEMEKRGMIEEHFSWPEIDINHGKCRINTDESQFTVPDKEKEDEINFRGIPNIMDLLGTYLVADSKHEGLIRLYVRCIENYGCYFHSSPENQTNLNRNDCIKIIYQIVIWHEFGHWVTHWMLDKSDNRWNSKTYNPNEKDLHEGLAQLFTHFAIINYTNWNSEWGSHLDDVFNFMLINQSGCYHKYKDILKNKCFSWENVMITIEAIRKEKDINKINLESLLDRLANMNHQ